MPKEILNRTMRTVNGRNGYIVSKDRDFRLDMAIPKEMGGVEDLTKTNPEELFSAGYSSCFASSMQYIMSSQKIEHGEFYAEAKTSLIQNVKEGGFKFAVTMTCGIEGVDEDTKKKVIEEAYQFCPYSRAIRNNVDVDLIIK